MKKLLLRKMWCFVLTMTGGDRRMLSKMPAIFTLSTTLWSNRGAPSVHLQHRQLLPNASLSATESNSCLWPLNFTTPLSVDRTQMAIYIYIYKSKTKLSCNLKLQLFQCISYVFPDCLLYYFISIFLFFYYLLWFYSYLYLYLLFPLMLYFCFYFAQSICNKNNFPPGLIKYSDSDSDVKTEWIVG